MRVGALDVLQGAAERWAPAAELGLQMMPLEFELADGFEKTRAGTTAPELRAVESKAAPQGLGVNVSEVGVDECDRVRRGLEAAKLGMMAIAARAALKDFASKERFPPERGEAPGIEISRVDGPESHDAFLVQPTPAAAKEKRTSSTVA
jgi:hypothetical protein